MPDNQLAIDAPGLGHNLPPLAEQLTEEVAFLRTRADELMAVARTAVIVDQESAEKVVNLVTLCRAVEKEATDAHKARKAPFLDAGRAVDNAYGAITAPIKMATDALRKMLTEFERKREAAAAAERRAAEAEQRQREEEAERLRQAAEEKASVGAKLDAMKAQEEADAARRRAEAIRPEPIRGALGQVSTRREIAMTVHDYRKALAFLFKNRTAETEAFVRETMGRHIRSLGVEAVERGLEIPGAKCWVEKVASVRQ